MSNIFKYNDFEFDKKEVSAVLIDTQKVDGKELTNSFNTIVVHGKNRTRVCMGDFSKCRDSLQELSKVLIEDNFFDYSKVGGKYHMTLILNFDKVDDINVVQMIDTKKYSVKVAFNDETNDIRFMDTNYVDAKIIKNYLVRPFELHTKYSNEEEQMQ